MKTCRLRYIFIIISQIYALSISAQRAELGKLSPWVRTIVTSQQIRNSSSSDMAKLASSSHSSPMLTAFVRAEGNANDTFSTYGCKVLLRKGDIYIVAIPIDRIAQLSSNACIKRIEAQRGTHALMDITGQYLGATSAYQAIDLPQAYTGKGVMVGAMDIGFDLTHPNFYDASATQYRIRSFWDQLSADTIASPHYVGNSYHGREALLRYAHSRDGLTQTHGTHTLGSLAGSGYRSRYRGIAYESDICIVANATSDNAALIDTADYYKYTYATDALGFKYIFDTADSLGMPCVISFSEGSSQDFMGYDQLYYAMLDSLTGPGHIIVSSAGNNSLSPSYIHKAWGEESRGNFIWMPSETISFTVNSLGDTDIRLVFYHDTANDTITIPVSSVLASADSILLDSAIINQHNLYISAVAYTNCYDSSRNVVDVELQTAGRIDALGRMSVEIVGKEADAELYLSQGYFIDSSANPLLSDAECTHNINSPSAAPSVICVGANSYRPSFENIFGNKYEYNMGTNGVWAPYSSVGPTYDGRTKPDVVAPGTNIISSCSSYYLENRKSNASDVTSDISHFTFQGRTYGWNANSGTSMSSPCAAGVIALWLQANPKLTPQDVMGIISHTSRHPDTSLSYPNNQYGYGEINAYAGLLDILGISAIKGISHHTPRGITISPISANRLILQFDDAPTSGVSIAVYSLSGSILHRESLSVSDTTYTIQLPTTIGGVVAVQIDGYGSQLVRLK